MHLCASIFSYVVGVSIVLPHVALEVVIELILSMTSMLWCRSTNGSLNWAPTRAPQNMFPFLKGTANDRAGFQIANDSSIGEVAGTSSVCWPWCFLSGNRCSFWPWRLCALGCYRLLAWTLGQIMQEDKGIFCVVFCSARHFFEMSNQDSRAHWEYDIFSFHTFHLEIPQAFAGILKDLKCRV